ncbi:MAG: 2-hydroxyacid dehydrogenase [Chloroflexota bacterium]
MPSALPRKAALVGPATERTGLLLERFRALAAEDGGAAEFIHVDSEQPQDDVAASLRDVVAIVPTAPGCVDTSVLCSLPELRLVQTTSAGTDWLDKHTLHKSGVAVANNGGGNAVAVAEHAIWLIVAVNRRLHEQIANARSGAWWADFDDRWDTAHDLDGQTVGIVGLGRIGSRVARRLQGWDCKVIYHDVAEFPEEYEQELEVERVPFDELLRSADVVTLHVPLERTTRHMMSTPQFQAMKNSAILINTCRGPVVDEKALALALSAGEFFGAGLDVTEVEPIEMDNPLLSMPNVVLTPHLATKAVESSQKSVEFAARNISRVARGEEPESVVPPV